MRPAAPGWAHVVSMGLPPRIPGRGSRRDRGFSPRAGRDGQGRRKETGQTGGECARWVKGAQGPTAEASLAQLRGSHREVPKQPSPPMPLGVHVELWLRAQNPRRPWESPCDPALQPVARTVPYCRGVWTCADGGGEPPCSPCHLSAGPEGRLGALWAHHCPPLFPGPLEPDLLTHVDQGRGAGPSTVCSRLCRRGCEAGGRVRGFCKDDSGMLAGSPPSPAGLSLCQDDTLSKALRCVKQRGNRPLPPRHQSTWLWVHPRGRGRPVWLHLCPGLCLLLSLKTTTRRAGRRPPLSLCLCVETKPVFSITDGPLGVPQS